jgi:hypothetical protein
MQTIAPILEAMARTRAAEPIARVYQPRGRAREGALVALGRGPPDRRGDAAGAVFSGITFFFDAPDCPSREAALPKSGTRSRSDPDRGRAAFASLQRIAIGRSLATDDTIDV